MKPNRLSLAALLAAASCLGAWAGDIFPSPRTQTLGAEAFKTSATYKLTGAETADPDAKALLEKSLTVNPADGTVEIVIGEAGDAAVASVAAKIPANPQGYYLSVAPGKVMIAGADAEGTYYGVQSFLQHIAGGDAVASTEVTDWPDNRYRGIVEGYYGNPWSHDDRMDMMENFMGHAKMNVYIYGPKNDAFHHGSGVFEPYPADVAAQLAEVAKKGLENKAHFVWAMHPGNNYEADHRKKAVEKFEAMYALGIRQFGIFFDDVNNYDVNKQVEFINHVHTNFIKAHSDIAPLIVCPSQYNQGWAGDGSYLATMSAGIDPEVEIMWTGGGVVDQKLGSSCQWFKEKSGRKPYIWLNYPCNDHGYANHALQLSPYSPADANIGELTTGFTANPMEYYHASKVGLYGISDFLWNSATYDPWAVWERIIGFLMPDNKDAFRTYCFCNFDYPQPGHNVVIPYEETPEFKALTEKYPVFTYEGAKEFNDFFNAQIAAGAELLGVSSPLIAEILEFVQAYKLQGERGLKLAEMRAALDAKSGPDFLKAYTDYLAMTDSAETLVSRNFEGSLRKYKGNSGNKYVEPYIVKSVNDLVNEFRDAGYEYPADLFPSQIVPSGNYFIMYKGRFLSNGSGAANNTPDRPTFRKDEDNINPARQSWTIRYDMLTQRYTITSAHDDRYVNELGVFGSNAFDSAWNTYEILGLNGKFAIRNAAKAGTKFWGVDGSNVNGKKTDYCPGAFIFELVPADGSQIVDTVAEIADGKTYVISDSEGRVLHRKTSGELIFDKRPAKLNDYYRFTLTLNDNKRFEIRSARPDKAFINEKGDIVTGQFYANWNTYQIYERNGKVAIQNAEDAKTEYWFINGDRIGKADQRHPDAYHFIFEDADQQSAIEEIGAETPADGKIFDLQGREVKTPAKGLYIVNGKKVLL